MKHKKKNEYLGYVFGFHASAHDPSQGVTYPLTDEQVKALGSAGKEAIDLIKTRTGLNLSGSWGAWRDGDDYPLRSMSTDYRGEKK